MVCKNCGSSLRSDFRYCPECGAKVIRNRLTLKNVWQDLSFQVFNLDNTFLKTFRHLFSKPAFVVDSYISGARKKYMNPISYFAIGVTLSGIMFFVLRNIYEIKLVENTFGETKGPDMDFIFDYQGLMSYFFLPYYALVTWVLFLDKAKLNYTEHLVANSYVSAQVFLVQVLISIPLFGLFDVRYDIVNWVFMAFMIAYQFYVFGKIHQTGFFSSLWRALAYVVLFFIFMMVVGVIFLVIMLVFGGVSLEDFAPKS